MKQIFIFGICGTDEFVQAISNNGFIEPVRLSSRTFSASQQYFFSNNKLANNIFSHDF